MNVTIITLCTDIINIILPCACHKASLILNTRLSEIYTFVFAFNMFNWIVIPEYLHVCTLEIQGQYTAITVIGDESAVMYTCTGIPVSAWSFLQNILVQLEA